MSGVKGLLAADWSKLQTLMNMTASTKNYITPKFRIFRTDSQLTTCMIFLIIVANGYFLGTLIGTKAQNNAFGFTLKTLYCSD